MLHKPVQNPAVYSGFAYLCNMYRGMLDVPQHEAPSQMLMTFPIMPKTLLFAACLPLYTTCCRRMFDVQQDEAL